MYRTVEYKGETEKAIIKRLAEIKQRGEKIIGFTIQTYDEKS